MQAWYDAATAGSTRSCSCSRGRSPTSRSTATATGPRSASTGRPGSRSRRARGSTAWPPGPPRSWRSAPAPPTAGSPRCATTPRAPWACATTSAPLDLAPRDPDRQPARLPGGARQHHRDAAAPRAAAGRHDGDDRPRRAGAPAVAVRSHGARGLRPRRPRRAGQVRGLLRRRRWLSRQAGVHGARREVQRARPRLGQRHRRLPERRGHLHRLHERGVPGPLHALRGAARLGVLAARGARFTYGPVLRHLRERKMQRTYERAPAWRRPAPS